MQVIRIIRTTNGERKTHHHTVIDRQTNQKMPKTKIFFLKRHKWRFHKGDGETIDWLRSLDVSLKMILYYIIFHKIIKNYIFSLILFFHNFKLYYVYVNFVCSPIRFTNTKPLHEDE